MPIHPMFWPIQAYVFWMNALMIPWVATARSGVPPLAAVALPAAPGPAAAVGLDPVSPSDIGTSATELR